jgi:hypothetical protein
MMSQKFQQVDGCREHALAERLVEMARAALEQAFEDYLARHLAIAGAATFEEIPQDVGLMALVAWSEVSTKLSRRLAAVIRDGVQDEPVDDSEWVARVEERASLYRLGEMPSR